MKDEKILTKNEMRFFQNDLLTELKKLEILFNNKIKVINDTLSTKITEYDSNFTKIFENITDLISQFSSRKFDNERIEELINMKVKFSEQIFENSNKIFILSKTLDNSLYKYDKAILDNLQLPGVIGIGCKYKNCRMFYEYIYNEITQYKAFKEEEKSSMKAFQDKIEFRVFKIETELNKLHQSINEICESKFSKYAKIIEQRIHEVNENIHTSRIENSKYATELIKTSTALKIDWERLENIKNEIFTRFDKELITYKKLNDSTNRSFAKQENEFKIFKQRFTQLAEYLKDFRNYTNKEFKELTKNIDFSKKQKLDENYDMTKYNKVSENLNNILRAPSPKKIIENNNDKIGNESNKNRRDSFISSSSKNKEVLLSPKNQRRNSMFDMNKKSLFPKNLIENEKIDMKKDYDDKIKETPNSNLKKKSENKLRILNDIKEKMEEKKIIDKKSNKSIRKTIITENNINLNFESKKNNYKINEVEKELEKDEAKSSSSSSSFSYSSMGIALNNIRQQEEKEKKELDDKNKNNKEKINIIEKKSTKKEKVKENIINKVNSKVKLNIEEKKNEKENEIIKINNNNKKIEKEDNIKLEVKDKDLLIEDKTVKLDNNKDKNIEDKNQKEKIELLNQKNIEKLNTNKIKINLKENITDNKFIKTQENFPRIINNQKTNNININKEDNIIIQKNIKVNENKKINNNSFDIKQNIVKIKEKERENEDKLNNIINNNTNIQNSKIILQNNDNIKKSINSGKITQLIEQNNQSKLLEKKDEEKPKEQEQENEVGKDGNSFITNEEDQKDKFILGIKKFQSICLLDEKKRLKLHLTDYNNKKDKSEKKDNLKISQEINFPQIKTVTNEYNSKDKKKLIDTTTQITINSMTTEKNEIERNISLNFKRNQFNISNLIDKKYNKELKEDSLNNNQNIKINESSKILVKLIDKNDDQDIENEKRIIKSSNMFNSLINLKKEIKNGNGDNNESKNNAFLTSLNNINKSFNYFNNNNNNTSKVVDNNKIMNIINDKNKINEEKISKFNSKIDLINLNIKTIKNKTNLLEEKYQSILNQLNNILKMMTSLYHHHKKKSHHSIGKDKSKEYKKIDDDKNKDDPKKIKKIMNKISELYNDEEYSFKIKNNEYNSAVKKIEPFLIKKFKNNK